MRKRKRLKAKLLHGSLRNLLPRGHLWESAFLPLWWNHSLCCNRMPRLLVQLLYYSTMSQTLYKEWKSLCAWFSPSQWYSLIWQSRSTLHWDKHSKQELQMEISMQNKLLIILPLRHFYLKEKDIIYQVLFSWLPISGQTQQQGLSLVTWNFHLMMEQFTQGEFQVANFQDLLLDITSFRPMVRFMHTIIKI